MTSKNFKYRYYGLQLTRRLIPLKGNLDTEQIRRLKEQIRSLVSED